MYTLEMKTILKDNLSMIIAARYEKVLLVSIARSWILIDWFSFWKK